MDVQYSDISEYRDHQRSRLGPDDIDVPEARKTQDLVGVVSLIQAYSHVLTDSISTTHLTGSIRIRHGL